MKKIKISYLFPAVAIISLLCWNCSDRKAVEITGEMKVWHKMTLTFEGPLTSEYDTLNPFTSYRLDVEFKNGEKSYLVPGYYAADGNAAETSAKSGNKWRVHFCPPSEGTWSYSASFLKGKNIAVADDISKGEKCSFDGSKGSFVIEKSDKTSPDFRAKGRLQYTGTHFLKYAGTGEPFLKAGGSRHGETLRLQDAYAAFADASFIIDEIIFAEAQAALGRVIKQEVGVILTVMFLAQNLDRRLLDRLHNRIQI